jgi:hypothetical protein
MRKQRITDDEVTALLEGRIPSGRTDLESVAAVVDALRLTSFEAPPRPSAELASRLDLERATWISDPAGGLPVDTTRQVTGLRTVPAKGRVRMLFSWFTGLGLAAKIVLGATGAAVATVGAGSVHVLPAAVQTAFDDTVTAVVGGEQASEGTTHTTSRNGTAATTGASTTGKTTTDGATATATATATGATTTHATGATTGAKATGTATVTGTAAAGTATNAGTTDTGVRTPANTAAGAGVTDDVRVNANATAHAEAVREAAQAKVTAGEHGRLVRDAAHSKKAAKVDAKVGATVGESLDATTSATETAGDGNAKTTAKAEAKAQAKAEG